MKFQPSPNKEGIIEALRHGEPITGIAKRFPESARTIKRYAKELREGKLDQPPKEPQKKEGGKLATVLQKSPGSIIFTLGQHEISLNPQHLYDAYLYYEDIVIRHDIDEEFSLAIKDSLKYVWQRFNEHKAEKEGISITMEGS